MRIVVINGTEAKGCAFQRSLKNTAALLALSAAAGILRLMRNKTTSLVIDTILLNAKENAAEPVYRLVNPEKIGVAGHSLGGAAALGIGRSRSDIGAVIALRNA